MKKTVEQQVIEIVDGMCTESLSPKVFEKWEDVKAGLQLSRPELQNKAEPDTYQLKEKNSFGNYNRFTDDHGKQEYKSRIVIDHITEESLAEQQVKFLTNATQEELSQLGWRRADAKDIEQIEVDKDADLEVHKDCYGGGKNWYCIASNIKGKDESYEELYARCPRNPKNLPEAP